MCGIVGIADFGGGIGVSPEQLSRMCATIEYRGPNDEGVDVADNVGLGMRRLSIIDLAGGMQPIFNEDRSVRTVFNGEIYNFKSLRDELVRDGHQFRTDGDTEVIVHAYEQFGDQFANRLDGMFAIAVHDSARKRLLLIRDQLGIKPLYYALNDNCLVWGSEIKVLLASGLVRPELDFDSLNEFLTWEYVPGSGTLLRGVRKLQPGEMLAVDLSRGTARVESYWDIPEFRDESRSDADWADAVESVIFKHARGQMVSDVPLGAFLSGGVDSSLVAAAMGSARTFSIGFDDPSYNELPFSQEVAQHLGMDHVTEVIQPHVADLFDDLMSHLDDPIGDFSIFPTYLVSRLARRDVTVVLSGDGADELFGGYETYAAEGLARTYQGIPGVLRRGLIEPVLHGLRPRSAKKGLINKAKRFVEGAAQPQELSHARWRMFMDSAMRARLFRPETLAAIERPADAHIVGLFERAGERSDLDRSLYVDVKSYLCDNILTKVDRMSMAVSLEARVPYLNPELVALAFQVPEHLKVHAGTTKVLLKQIAARHVPKHCVYRQKEGFSIPIKNWLGTQFRPIMEELLDAGRLRDEGIFDSNAVELLKREHLSGRANHSHVLWSLIVFEAWRDRWLTS